MSEYKDKVKIGILQTNVDVNFAWNNAYDKLTGSMNEYAEEMVAEEIRKGFKYFNELEDKPDIILIPEYSIPKSLEKLVQLYSSLINAVVFCGLDLVHLDEKTVANQGKIIVPASWPMKTVGKKRGHEFYWGKTYFAMEELEWFQKINVIPRSEEIDYIIDAGDCGNIGIALCSDFYDLNRFMIYKGRIHHLFIISYNKDAHSFEVLTEAISRLLMCNVVICNSGHYGNSLAFSPYKESTKRLIYKASGSKLFTVQTIDIPLKKLDEDQQAAGNIKNKNPLSLEESKNLVFKLPPGYEKKTMRFFINDNLTSHK